MIRTPQQHSHDDQTARTAHVLSPPATGPWRPLPDTRRSPKPCPITAEPHAPAAHPERLTMGLAEPAPPGQELRDQRPAIGSAPSGPDASAIDVRGCDLRTFGHDGKIVRKDTFGKIHDT